jgi:hypothetical protein
MGCTGIALFEHPVFKIELLADDFKNLIDRTSPGFWYAPDRTARSITRCCSGFRSIDMVFPSE